MTGEKEQKKKLITEAVIQEVSIVDQPANNEKFFLIKSEERREMDPKEIARKLVEQEEGEQKTRDKFESLNKRFDALAETLGKMVDKIAETAEIHQQISEKLEKIEKSGDSADFCVVTADGRVLVEGVEIETASKQTRGKIAEAVEALSKILEAAPEAQIERIRAEVDKQLAELRETIKKVANTSTDSQADAIENEETGEANKSNCKWEGLGIPRRKLHQ